MIFQHSKRAVYLANRLCDGWGITDYDRDIVISACLIHDIAKTKGKDVSFKWHPVIAKAFYCNRPITNDFLGKINSAVEHHMGLWTPQCIKKPIKDYSLIELAVYTCDYMATTKTLITPVDNEEINV